MILSEKSVNFSGSCARASSGVETGVRNNPRDQPGCRARCALGTGVTVDMPSAEGGLLAGEAGALFDRMLVAIGRSRETIYLASLSPIRTPTGIIDERNAARLGDVARHHIALVAPRTLLLFGDICGKALVGAPVAGARGRWHEIATAKGPIKTLVTIKPEKLNDMPGMKKLAWADLQMLMEELK